MAWWLLALGVALLLAVTVDALATVVSASTRSGPVAERLSHWLWRIARRVAGDDHSTPLIVAGPVILVTTTVAWISAFWAGWWLIFAADPTAVVDSRSLQPADLVGRAYYAAYTVFTLGNGDYSPHGAPWQLVTAVAVVSGLALVTLVVTYFIPVVTAVTERRQLGALVSTFGHDASSIVTSAWDGSSFRAFERRVEDLVPSVLMTAQRHLTYPIIHYFHTTDRGSAFPPSVAALDEAVGMVSAGTDPAVRPDPVVVRSFRAAVDQLMDIVHTGYEHPEAEPPEIPELAAMRRVGIPTVSDAAFADALASDRQRRSRLRSYVTQARWSWDRHVVGGGGNWSALDP
ncbi:MAG TPA: potassium channel family protein [Nitriliruptorales bacterium]|nr:potassium channel family protein [Nitriliruptorales bacterium]